MVGDGWKLKAGGGAGGCEALGWKGLVLAGAGLKLNIDGAAGFKVGWNEKGLLASAALLSSIPKTLVIGAAPVASGVWNNGAESPSSTSLNCLLRRRISSPVVSALRSPLSPPSPLANSAPGKESLGACPLAAKLKMLAVGTLPSNAVPPVAGAPNDIDCCTTPSDFRGVFRCLLLLFFADLMLRAAS